MNQNEVDTIQGIRVNVSLMCYSRRFDIIFLVLLSFCFVPIMNTGLGYFNRSLFRGSSALRGARGLSIRVLSQRVSAQCKRSRCKCSYRHVCQRCRGANCCHRIINYCTFGETFGLSKDLLYHIAYNVYS